MMVCKRVLLVEDEKDVREAAKVTLELEGFDVTEASSGDAAIAFLDDEWKGVIVTDVRMPGMNGMELLSKLKKRYPDLPVILVTGHGDVSMALSAVRSGAYDFIEKPVAPELLIDVVQRAMQTQNLILENKDLRDRLASMSKLEGRIIGSCGSIVELRKLLHNLAEADVDVLIHGETGTGKELIARALHDFSERKSGQFVALNCGALPESVIESELFGHEAGAFTGATKRRIGKIEFSASGTLFLDEIESMPMHLQVKLLRVLQERVVERLGGNATIPVDIRVIAATKCDLLELSKQGEFRDDFYYRLSVAQIEIPPLRERINDIPILFSHFVQLASDRLNKEVPIIENRHMDDLISRKWEGNVRELRNVAERFVLGISRRLTDVIQTSTNAPENGSSLDEQLAIYEQRIVESALARNNGRVAETAIELGIPRKKLYLRMKRFGIDKTNFKAPNE
ncbi:sigma-54-dependent transcriptional regulator [Kiloniella sp.]|uniref:sigma-54-dependent transcriptional regulator n=1 Tax=Kiloniella sp. TaxID=1938587 RepID=UPI003A8DFDF6